MSSLTNATSSNTSHSSDPILAVLFPSVALPATIFCIPPLIAHVKAQNLAASVLTTGVAIMNLQSFVNAMIWRTNDLDDWDGQGLCDIEVKLFVGLSVAVIGATTAIFRQLAIILDTKRMVIIPSSRERRQKLIIECIFCVLLPVCAMIAHYVVQPERYWIITILGCAPSFDRSWPSYVLNFIWPVILALIGTMYCGLTIIRLIRYHRHMSAILSTRSSISKSRFIRLFSLALTLLVAYFPLVIYTFIQNLNRPRIPYSWQRVHAPGWSTRIERVPLDSQNNGFDRWVQIATGWLIFAFFGLGHEAVSMYKSWFSRLGIIKQSKQLVATHESNIPATRSASGRSLLSTDYQMRDLEN